MRQRLGTILTFVFSVAAVVAFATVAMRRPPAAPVGQGVNDWIGRRAPGFALKTLDGKNVSLAEHKGQVVVLDFWATWCPVCVAEMPAVAAVAKKYADRGVAYYAVNVGEPPAVVQDFLDRNKLSIPVLMDSEVKASTAYDAEYLPLLVVIDGGGQVVAYDNLPPDSAGPTLTRWIESALQSGQAK